MRWNGGPNFETKPSSDWARGVHQSHLRKCCVPLVDGVKMKLSPEHLEHSGTRENAVRSTADRIGNPHKMPSDAVTGLPRVFPGIFETGATAFSVEKS